jgi:hypothetical protein
MQEIMMDAITKQAGQQLIDAAKKDMQIRTELLEAGELMNTVYHPRMEQCHIENAALLEKFLDTYGWPVPSKWGKEVHDAAWLIGIHAVGQPKVLKRVFHYIEKLWQTKEVDGGNYARLYDRIALYEGRPQKYGTQLWTSPKGWYAANLESPDKVDEWRASVGLDSLEDWIKESSEGDFNGFTDDEQSPQDEQFVLWLKSCGWRK